MEKIQDSMVKDEEKRKGRSLTNQEKANAATDLWGIIYKLIERVEKLEAQDGN